jgi:precorrin-2/cobalt-factor-2 C20-methyltransferase
MSEAARAGQAGQGGQVRESGRVREGGQVRESGRVREGGRAARPTLAGVGVGPGDPELITVKAVRVLREADLVLVPVLDPAEQGRAEATVRAHAGHDRIRRAVFALGTAVPREAAPDSADSQEAARDAAVSQEAAWDGAAAMVADAIRAGAALVAFATIGDPSLYSTFTYLARAARRLVPGLEVATVPGITAMQDLAARTGTVLCEGDETLALLPLTASLTRFRKALASFDTVVGYKSGRHLPAVLAAVAEAGRLDQAVHGARLGLDGEDIRPAAAVTGPAPYLSTLLVPPRRRPNGGVP